MNSNQSEPSDFDIASAARTSFALFDLSDRTQMELTGADRAQFLHGFTTNDIKRLKPGQGCETFVTNLKGKVIAHLFAFCTQNAIWLDGAHGQDQTVLKHLRQYLIIEDVQLIPHSDDRADLYVSGPLASQFLQLERDLGLYEHVTRDFENGTFEIRRVDLLGTIGYLMSIPRSRIDVVKYGMRTLGILEGTHSQFESLRIEAGFPSFGVDITDDNLAQEVARTKQCVSFTKGCYLGQETVARLDALGHTNRELRRLRLESNRIPQSGSVAWDEQLSAEMGFITSAASHIPREESDDQCYVNAIALMKRAACAAETPVKIKLGDHIIAGRVI